MPAYNQLKTRMFGTVSKYFVSQSWTLSPILVNTHYVAFNCFLFSFTICSTIESNISKKPT